MAKRLKQLLRYYQELVNQSFSPEEMTHYRDELLIQIQFFQHERLIHLIVTVLFALLTVLTLFAALFLEKLILLVLFLLFFDLLFCFLC